MSIRKNLLSRYSLKFNLSWDYTKGENNNSPFFCVVGGRKEQFLM